MRYDVPVYLQTRPEAVYEHQTGNYRKMPVKEELFYGSVSADTAAESALKYGQIRTGSLTIHFQNRLPSFDTLRIGSKIYKADSSEELRRKTVLQVSEVSP